MSEDGRCLAARLPLEDPGGLAHLYQVSIRVAEVAPDLASMVLRGREELGAPCAPVCVDRLHVRYADVEEAAH